MFFSKYPLIEYIFTEKSGVAKKKLATNILRRAGFAEGSKLDNSFFVRYDIQDGDRPDIIADKIYDDSEYSWVVLLFNNIVNPYEEWPKDSLTLERDIEKKYEGYSLFISGSTGEHLSTPSFFKNQVIARGNSAGLDIYGVPFVDGSVKNKPILGRVAEWDPQYGRLDVVTNYPQSFSEGNYITAVGATGQALYDIKIQRRVLRTDALYHFERRESGSTSDFVILNPLASTEIDGQIPLGATGFSSGAVTDAAKGGTIAPNGHDANPVQFGETLVGRYMGICGDNNNDNILTNRVFEIRENDKKREIRLLHPQFLVDAIEEFENLIRTGSVVG